LQANIAPIPEGKKLPQADADQRASLVFNGLKAFPFLSADLKKALDDLMHAHPNILSLHQKSSLHTTV
jgi:hypothetical protein